MNKTHTVELVNNGVSSKVFVDGVELKGVTNITFSQKVGELPKLSIDLIAQLNNVRAVTEGTEIKVYEQEPQKKGNKDA